MPYGAYITKFNNQEKPIKSTWPSQALLLLFLSLGAEQFITILPGIMFVWFVLPAHCVCSDETVRAALARRTFGLRAWQSVWTAVCVLGRMAELPAGPRSKGAV